MQCINASSSPHYRLVFEHKRADFGSGKPALKASMGLWSMNPAVGFRQMADTARAVLLASGQFVYSVMDWVML